LNVLITGLPRSGTTLVCELLNELPDTVALDEPTVTDHPSSVIDDLLRQARESLLTRGRAVSTHVGGRVQAAKWSDEPVRRPLADVGEIRIDKPLSPSFLLVVKHTGRFTAVLESLAARYRVYAVVRNPLGLLLSWQTVALPVADGHVSAEQVDPDLAAALAQIPDRVDRQLHILDWFFERYRSLLPPASVIRYESIVSSGGRALSVVTSAAAALDRGLENRNGRWLGAPDLAERLLASDGAYWSFYTKESVESLRS
jgi:hypothetical protein